MKIQYLIITVFIQLLWLGSLFSQNYDPEFIKAEEYYESGQYRKAAQEFEAGIPYVEEDYGKNDTILLTPLLIYTGVCYENSGDYVKAEQYYLRTKNIFENLDAIMTHGYAVSLNNLAQLYDNLGRYQDAEQLYLRTIEIDTLVLGKDHPDYANSLNNLASLYQVMGRYEQAETLFIEGLNILKEQMGEEDWLYALFLSNLAHLYTEVENYDEAEKLYKLSIEIAKNSQGINHPQYAKYLNNLGQLYYFQRQYEKAEPLFIEAKTIAENTLGKDHPSYAKKLNNLASLYTEQGKYNMAEPMLIEAAEINKNQFGEYHLEYAKIIDNLSYLNIKKGQYSQAYLLNKQVFNIYQYQIRTNTGFLSQKEMKQFLSTFLYHLDIFQSFNCDQINNKLEVGRFAYEIELANKGVLLMSTLGIKNRILESNDSATIEAYYELGMLKRKLDNLMLMNPQDKTENIVDLRNQIVNLGKKLTLKSLDYQRMQKGNKVTWEEVRQKLKSGEAAIEFSSFNFYNDREATHSIYYCATVLKSDDTIPNMIFLCDESELSNAIPQPGVSNRNINYLYQVPTLYELIWKPFEKLLDGINTIYFAPSGLLNSVSLTALATPNKKLLMEKYNFIQLSSTRTLALEQEPISITDAAIFGGIIYDTDTTTLINKTEAYKESDSDILAYNRSYTGDYRSGFRYLPGSKEEVESISSIAEKKNITVTIYSGTDAVEESFLALSKKESPSIIHLSTHGFYFPDTVSEENRKNIIYSSTGEVQFRYSDDPLLRSGLLMAGANLAWQGKSIPENVEDGILTAKEVSNMNLMKTDLVVLSACQSGLGDVKGSEGVEGLQRGFKMAGVRYIIMSLWQVPDKETTEFMETFYGIWLDGDDIHKAFRDTQIAMKNNYPDDPFKWAGFVLME